MDGYKKIKVLGKGTYGTVYLCEKSRKDKIVLKELNVNLHGPCMQAAGNEIKILKKLNHPNVIKYFKHLITPKCVFIFMEHASKGNLYEMISKYRQKNVFISQQIVLSVICQILLGLDHIHSKNIIHRDLKCENILISGFKYDIIKIADFGISKILETEGQANTVIGTPNYLAPEICDGKPYNTKSDIWALGCILYELCALERMFHGSISNVVLSIAQGNIKQIEMNFYDKRLQQIIELTLITDPESRPDTQSLIRHPVLLPVTLRQLVDLGGI